MAETRRYAIIGSGVAGLAAVEAIRSLDAEGAITLISADPFGYYSRPGLAYLLTGEVSERLLYPYRKPELERLKVSWIEDRVEAIDPSLNQLHLARRGLLGYDRLLLATGSKAVRPDIPGTDLKGILTLDTLEDARELLGMVRHRGTAVVVGGGITALELAEGLHAQGMKVHYLLRGDHYWSNVLDETESGIIEACLAEDRIQLHFHTELHELVGKKGRLQAVRVRSGQEVREIKASMLAIAIGIQPRKELAVKGGLKVDRGILVDDCLATSHAGIYAAGDVAQVYDPASQSYILDSLWSPAREQGRVAGLNMAGVETHYCKPPALNVTRLAGITTTIIGAVGRGRDADLVSITHGDSEAWRQKPDAQIAQHSHEVNRVRLLIGKSTLLGAIVMGEQSLSEPLKRIVSEQVDITPIREQLIQDQSRIKELILGFGGHNA